MNGFNLSERAILVINLFIAPAILLFLWFSANDIYQFHRAGSVLPNASDHAGSKRVDSAGGARARSYYDQIVARDIFNLAPPPAPPPVENENLEVKLVGVSQVSEGRPWAIVQDENGKQNLYQLDQEIPGAGKLVAVERDRAIVLHNGHRVAMEVPRGSLQPGPDLAVPPTPGFIRRLPRQGRRGVVNLTTGIHRMGANNYALDRSMVETNLKNMGPLFTQMRATPRIENGVASGFRLSEIQPNSIFQQIGLQDGDLLKSVNGQSVGDPAKAMTLLQSLHSQPSITIDVVRNGTPTTLHYNIR